MLRLLPAMMLTQKLTLVSTTRLWIVTISSRPFMRNGTDLTFGDLLLILIGITMMHLGKNIVIRRNTIIFFSLKFFIRFLKLNDKVGRQRNLGDANV